MARTAKVGREKDPDPARIRALAPDLVVANMEENRREVVEALRAAGVPVWVAFPRTVAEGIELVRELGALTDTVAAATAMADSLEAARARAIARAAARPRVRVFCPIWRRPYMTVNRDTYVHDVLRTCGGDNVFGASADALPDGDSRGGPRRGAGGHPAPGRAVPVPRGPPPRTSRRSRDVPAVRTGRVQLIDGKLLSWYGPRIADSLERLPALLVLEGAPAGRLTGERRRAAPVAAATSSRSSTSTVMPPARPWAGRSHTAGAPRGQDGRQQLEAVPRSSGSSPSGVARRDEGGQDDAAEAIERAGGGARRGQGVQGGEAEGGPGVARPAPPRPRDPR